MRTYEKNIFLRIKLLKRASTANKTFEKGINCWTHDVFCLLFLNIFCVYVSLLCWGTGAVVAAIVWKLDLRLPVQSVPIATDVVSSNSDQGEVYNIM